MKTLLSIITAFSITTATLLGQTSFEPQIKASYEIGIDDYKNKSFGAEFLAGIRTSDLFRIGIGTGIYWCEHLYEDAHFDNLHYYKEYRETAAYVPLYAEVKYNFTRTKWSPYIASEFGYSFFIPYSDYAKDNELGFMMKPLCIGVNCHLNRGAIFFEWSYKFQARTFKLLGDNVNYSQSVFSFGYQF